jgi:type IV pilus modification protein PilV
MPIVLSKKIYAFSLIEILATVLIVNFGVVGIIKLQMLNYQQINNSILATRAAYYSETLVEKLLGNSETAKENNSPYILNNFTDTPTQVAATAVCIVSSCTRNLLAVYDMNSWLFKIKNNFPSGKARVTRTINASNTLYTITIQWQYKNETKNYELVTQL